MRRLAPLLFLAGCCQPTQIFTGTALVYAPGERLTIGTINPPDTRKRRWVVEPGKITEEPPVDDLPDVLPGGHGGAREF